MKRLVLALATLGLMSWGARARAEDRIEVSLAANAATEQLLAPLITELVTRLKLQVVLHAVPAIDPLSVIDPSPDAEPALARVFIDATRTDVALLYTVDGKWERVLVRRLPLERDLERDEVAREELAHIVESSIAALQAGGQIGITRAEASEELGVVPPGLAKPAETAPKQAPPRPSRRREENEPLELRVGVGWGLALWTPELPLHGPEVRADLSVLQRRLSWGAVLTAQYRLRSEQRTQPVGVSTEGAALRLLGRVRYLAERRFGVVAEAGIGFDYQHFEPIGADTGVRLGAPGSRTVTILAAKIGVEAQLFGPLWLSTLGGAELDLAPDDYVLQRDERVVTVAEPLRLRPAFFASLLCRL